MRAILFFMGLLACSSACNAQDSGLETLARPMKPAVGKLSAGSTSARWPFAPER